jgi:hypothetical protein
MKKYFLITICVLLITNFFTSCSSNEEAKPDGELVTLCDLKARPEKYKGRFVRIENVQFVSTDVGKTFGGTYTGNTLTNPNGTGLRTLQDCAGNTITVATDPLSSFVGAIIPNGNGTFKGVISVFSNNVAQISVTNTQDFAGLVNTRCNITPTPCPATLETIANVRALGVGATISAPIKVRGVVISDWAGNNVTGSSTQRQNFVVQDATAGMTFRLSAATSGANPFPYLMGETVEINLQGKTVGQFNDQVQISGLAISDITDLGVVDPMPTAQIITIAQLNSDAFESQLIQINGVTFGTGTYSGNQNFTVGASTGTCRTNPAATFSGNSLPTGTVNIRGIAGRNLTSRQIQPRNTSDLP